MSKILFPDQEKWYDELNTVAYYSEKQFERSIRQYLCTIFPDFIGFSFSLTLTDGTNRNKPDLALIKKDYTEWWIVEVELGTDNFNHVKQQIQTFSRGDYNPYTLVPYIENKILKEHNFQIDTGLTTELISKNAPNILVMVDVEKPEWINDIQQLGGQIFVFQTFKSPEGSQLFRLSGTYPTIKTSNCHCRFHSSIPNLLKVSDPSVVDQSGGELSIFYSDRLTSWTKIKDNSDTYLKFNGIMNPLHANSTYQLYKDTLGNFHFQIN